MNIEYSRNNCAPIIIIIVIVIIIILLLIIMIIMTMIMIMIIIIMSIFHHPAQNTSISSKLRMLGLSSAPSQPPASPDAGCCRAWKQPPATRKFA
jgi:hypothetical protein